MTEADARTRGLPLLLALSAGLVLADSSVVTLALPAILREFDAGVGEVAWVLIAFNLALALAALPCARLARGRSAFVVASVAFAAASLACAAAPSLEVLIAARAVQGIVGAAVVAAALALLLRALPRRRAIGLWAAAGVLGAALGPAAGGVLTEAFSWQAMFALQAPVALLGVLGARRGAVLLATGATATSGPQEAGGPRVAPLAALLLVSAALAAALFLLVVMLIEGWRRSPGEAALIVTAMPLAALLAGRVARDARSLGPALPGCVLLAGGLAALGLLPDTGAGWTIAPQLAIGAGLGLALGALIGVTVAAGGDGAVARPAAWTIAARHAGIVAGLLVLTPIFQADLDAAREPAERAGLARVLDAPIDLKAKIALARALDREITGAADQQLPDLAAAFAAAPLPAGERADAARLRAELEAELDGAATSAFRRSFLVAALLALLAAGVVAVAVALARGAAANAVAIAAAAAAATLLVGAHVALGGTGYGPTAVADPCAARERAAGVDRTQLVLLATLDGGACRLRLAREDLLLTLISRRNPAGVSDAELGDALGDGIDRAQREGALPGFAAAVLRLALRTGGPTALIGRLLDG